MLFKIPRSTRTQREIEIRNIFLKVKGEMMIKLCIIDCNAKNHEGI